MLNTFTKPDAYKVVAFAETDTANGRSICTVLTSPNHPDWDGVITKMSRDLAIRLRDQLNKALEG